MIAQALLIISLILLSPFILLVICACGSSGYISGGSDVDSCGDNIDYGSIKDILDHINQYAKSPILAYSYDQLGRLKYNERTGVKKMGCHDGQRKLLLTEIQFATNCCRSVDFIIYAGSAPCTHLPILLELFPTKKFLLIDPRFHDFKHASTYVYQNISVVPQSVINNHVKRSGKHLARQSRMPFYKSTSHDITKTNAQDMKQIQNEFNTTHYKSLVSDIVSGNCRVYVIQDYMTRDIATLLAESVRVADVQMCFISDIRTNLFKSYPTDLDIIWNDVLQLMIIKILRPTYSMIKFHPPYMVVADDYKYYDNPPTKQKNEYDMIKSDIEYAKEHYGIDTLSNLKRKKYMYMSNSMVCLQAWAPVSSSETRLIIAKVDIDKPYIHYDHQLWDDRFMHLKHVRGYVYHKFFYEHIRGRKDHTYDGCFDCTLDIFIILNYMFPSKTGIQPIDVNILSDKFKDHEVQQRWIYITQRLIPKYIRVAWNQKCPFHSRLTHAMNDMYIYSVHNSGRTNCILQHRMDNKTMMSKKVATWDDTKKDIKLSMTLSNNTTQGQVVTNIFNASRMINRPK